MLFRVSLSMPALVDRALGLVILRVMYIQIFPFFFLNILKRSLIRQLGREKNTNYVILKYILGKFENRFAALSLKNIYLPESLKKLKNM